MVKYIRSFITNLRARTSGVESTALVLQDPDLEMAFSVTSQ